jgi:hypothetical protein
MNDQARQVLLTLRGKELTRSLLKGTLADLCPQCPGERAALLAAFDNGVVQELGGSVPSGDQSLRLSRLVKSLEADACLNPEAARWAVESFALFYGITSAPTKSVIAAPATSSHPNEQNRRATSSQANKPSDRLETVPVVPPPIPKSATSSNSRVPPDRFPPAPVVASKTTQSKSAEQPVKENKVERQEGESVERIKTIFGVIGALLGVLLGLFLGYILYKVLNFVGTGVGGIMAIAFAKEGYSLGKCIGERLALGQEL